MTIYTDGSCYYKTKEGGYAIYFKDTGKAFTSGWTNTSTERMELRALLAAIKMLPNEDLTATIILDNQYVVNTLREGWVYKWQHENWVGRANADLWKQVLEQIKSKPLLKVRTKHVKGHQKDLTDEHAFYNNLVDKLADYKNFKNKKRNVDKSK
jgi:ribonuclease HI